MQIKENAYIVLKMPRMYQTSYSNLLLSSSEIILILEKNVSKQTEKKKKKTHKICNTFLFEVFSESNLQVTSKHMKHSIIIHRM